MIRSILIENSSIVTELMRKKNSSHRPKNVTDEVAAVVDVDIEAGRIIVDPEAAGLIDDGSSSDDEWPEEGEEPKPES